MSIRAFYAIFLLIFTLAAGVFFSAGCDQQQRHNLLVFFIDGVPPLGGWDPNDPNSPYYRNKEISSQDAGLPQVNLAGSVHEPQRQCELCHGQKSMDTVPGSIDLIENQPDLCYNCHTDYANTGDYLHGPVAVGECLFCHLPHKSKYKSLLKKPIPDMCFTCHNKDMINEIPDHNPELLGKCNFCHHAHSGPQKGLLRMNTKRGTKLDYQFGN